MGTIGIYRRCKKRFQGVWKYDTGLKWVKGNIYSSLQIRSSSSQIFFKIGLLKNLDNFLRKLHVLESLFNKFACLKTCNFIKNDSNTGVFL